MRVRLGFAVAAYLPADILIVDEVLSVGDAAFQKKCLGKMSEVANQGGRTVLFVSHNMIAVQSLCPRCLLLEDGKIKSDVVTAKAVALYLQATFEKGPEHVWEDAIAAPGNEVIRFALVSVVPEASKLGSHITMESSFRIETEYWVRKAGAVAAITYHLFNQQGIVVLTTGSQSAVHAFGRYRSVCRIPGGLLNSGAYYLKLLVVEDGARVTYSTEEVASFHVTDTQERSEGWMGREPGVVQPVLPWKTERLSD
jgi:lipopolysaccharide transport system ATP-binding protein